MAEQPEQHSLLTLASPGVVAGDRFREVGCLPLGCELQRGAGETENQGPCRCTTGTAIGLCLASLSLA